MSLDDNLAAWAASIALTDAEAAAMYERIVTTPAAVADVAPGLDPGWWREFTSDFTARMISSTRPTDWAA